MTLRPRGRAIVPAAAAALLLAACGTSADPAPPERPRTTAQPVRLPEPLLERPVDTARLSPLELAAVGRAELIERAACMRRYGFDDRVRFTRSLYATLPDRSYGVMTDEDARRHGYHMAPDVDPRVPANQKKQTDLVTSRPPRTAADRRVRALVLYGTASDTLTEADARRADGPQPPREAKVIGTYKDRPVREGGCAEEARDRIVGDGGSERNPVAMRIYLNGFAQAEKDPKVRRAVKAWSSCMARKGYAYDSPLDAGTDLPTAREPAPDAREKTVARADMACKHITRLIEVWSAAEARHERRAMAGEKTALAAETARKKRMLERALKVLATTEDAAS
ncbi:hypothetical protein ACFWIO_27580 [Streptomyces diastatochromogenes]|uniref:hypothetical protein n=1 Tax=Streptomyces diastatochromogenes TaxID=42236 RepID=UPI00364A7301